MFNLTEMKSNSMSNTFKIYKTTALVRGMDINKFASIKSHAELFCILSCNSNPDCLTVVFESMQSAENNCFLFNRIFDSTKHTLSIISSLYEKKSKRVSNHA